MIDIFQLVGKIIVHNKEANDSIEETTSKASGAKEKLSNTFSKIGSVAVTMGKVIAAGAAAGATAVSALATAAINGYADYEQLVGGVETLFGAGGQTLEEYAASVGKSVAEAKGEFYQLMYSQNEVIKNANNAYKTSGLSANEYMETVTSFSASLLQSLDGDTSKAAKVADRAITDMSDNANKMGTDISMIQNAYQGFAKQNYTMLDNLKLGYGGTKEEMQRLIEDANALKVAQGGMADLTIESYADIIEAIGLVQDKMGITGTTAKEASETITGSVSAMKSSWKNLVTGMADDHADMETLIDNFVESASTAAENILPRVEIALNGAATLIEKLLPIIVDKIPEIITNTLPKIVSAAVKIVESLVRGISQNQGMLMTTAFDLIVYLSQSILNMLPEIIKLGLDLIVSLATGIAESLPELIPTIIDVVNQIVETLTDEETLTILLDSTLELILAIAEGLATFTPNLIGTALNLITSLVTFLLAEENINKIIDVATELISTLAIGLASSIGVLAEEAGEMAAAIVTALMEVDWIQVGLDILEGIGKGLWDGWTTMETDHPVVANAILSGANAMMGITPMWSMNTIDGSHASGLENVPFDGYIAELHRGEMVLPRAEAEVLRSADSSDSAAEISYLLKQILGAIEAGQVIKLNERELGRTVRTYA